MVVQPGQGLGPGQAAHRRGGVQAVEELQGRDALIQPGLNRRAEVLHPTPAVGGLPRAEALAWLDDHEGLDRGWYAGPIGWVDGRGEGVFVVALRSALVRGAEATAFVGCGLVRGSEPRAEWDETRAKLGTILGSLRAAPVAKT